MRLYASVIVTALIGTSAGAAESVGSRYSNVSFGQGQSVAAAPSISPPPAAAPRIRPTPRAARRIEPRLAAPAPAVARLPTPAAPAAPVWPWAVLAVGLGGGAAALFRSRDAQRRREEGSTLALAAHELKSPLSAIESYLDLMAQGAPTDARDARRWLEDVQHMKTTASHLRRTIGDILDMTRIEDGRLKLSPRGLPLKPLLDEVAAEYGALARSRGVGVSVSLAADAPAVFADPDRLRQVLHNLLGNALKFTPSGGAVQLRAGAEGGRPCIDVRDEGVGVPAASRGKLFGKFSRLAPALDNTEGTGLGLYISRRLVEAQGGRLTYAPGPGGRGSVFRVTLPKADAA